MINPEELRAIESVCVIAWGLIGDVFIRVPVVEQLKIEFPDKKIIVVVESIARPVFEESRFVDEVVTIDRDKNSRFEYLLRHYRGVRRLRQLNVQLCIDMYGGGSSPLLSCLSGAKYRVGFDHKFKHRIAYNVPVPCPAYCRQWIKDFALLLGPLGIRPEKVRVGTSFSYAEADNKAVTKYLEPGNHYVCINLGARDPVKCWPVEKYVELAKRINQQTGYIPLVLTNPGQEYLASSFTRKYGTRCVNPPVLPLGQVGAIIDACDYMITGDTSLMHMAFGLHKPTLVLFTYTRPEWHLVQDCHVQYCFRDDPTSKNWRCGKPWGTKDISVDEVFAKFLQLQKQVDEKLVNFHEQ